MNSNEKHGRQLTLEEASKLARKSSHNFKAMLQPGASVTFEVIANAIDAHLAPREVRGESPIDKSAREMWEAFPQFAEHKAAMESREAVAWQWRTKRGINEWTLGWAIGNTMPTRENCHLQDGDEIEIRPLYTHPRATSDEVERDSASAALRFAARIVELYDDATMRSDHMIASGDCAEILNALADRPEIIDAALAKRGEVG